MILREHEHSIQQIPSIPLSVLVKKTNQNIFRSFENFLELSGNMNEIERKKALYQVLYRVRTYYLSLHLLSEWSKISSNHLLLKVLLFESRELQNRLHHLGSSLNSHLQQQSLSFPNFLYCKELNNLKSRHIPSFFADPIGKLSSNLAPSKVVGNDGDWNSSLESLLYLEVTKNIPEGEDIELVSIEKSKCIIMVSSRFVFELTLVPFQCHAAWFVLNVEGSAEFRSLFKNGLTGIFQSRYNNRLCSDFNIFTSAVRDCKKYVGLFFFEKLYSEFSYLSALHGRQNLAFYHDGKTKSFQIKPWFMSVPLSIGFSHDNGFEVCDDFKSLFVPKLAFGVNDAKHLLSKLFDREYGAKILNLILSLYDHGLIGSYEYLSESCFKLAIFDEFNILITLSHVEKRVNVKFSQSLGELSAIAGHIEEAIIGCDYPRLANTFTILCSHTFRKIFFTSPELRVVDCIGISDQTTTVLAKLESKILVKTTFQADGMLIMTCLTAEMESAKGILSFKFVEDFEKVVKIEIPQNQEKLYDLVSTFVRQMPKDESGGDLSDVVSILRLKGDFLDESSFSIFSQGFPSCIISAILKEIDRNTFSIAFETVFDTYNVDVEMQFIPKLLSNAVKILWIYENSSQLGYKSGIDHQLNVSIAAPKGDHSIALTDTFDFVVTGNLKDDLIACLDSPEFSPYLFFELLN